MNEICSQVLNHEYVLLIAVMALEFWLGKTDKTKSGSIIEFIFNIVLALGQRRKQKE